MLGGDRAAAAAAARDLERRYAEPHRRYHTSAHISAVLDDLAWLSVELGIAADDRALVGLAACAHDVVYNAQPGTDERASAEWVRDVLHTCGLSAPTVEVVVGLVLATIDHAADSNDARAAALLDADLAILAAAPGDYDEYVRGVRVEYAGVSDPQWRAGRTAVLRELLKRPAIYHSEPARQRWEQRARANIERELVAAAASLRRP